HAGPRNRDLPSRAPRASLATHAQRHHAPAPCHGGSPGDARAAAGSARAALPGSRPPHRRDRRPKRLVAGRPHRRRAAATFLQQGPMNHETLTVALGERSYPIHIGTNLVGRAELYAPHVAGRLAAIVTNVTVAPLLGEAVRTALETAGA